MALQLYKHMSVVEDQLKVQLEQFEYFLNLIILQNLMTAVLVNKRVLLATYISDSTAVS
ncbi:hypothetical protein [Francisella tularensis]|uniref:hypothetical protein n=1 Tax=Francisella tularensis TaxID=263 RepID=UPI002381C5B7|nr:hypothetical protein [Francisella tularensis]MDE5000881.1 hypothetical protein [Francisella tularensis subsp. holarctica]